MGDGHYCNPCPAGYVSSGFGYRWGGMHRGVDLACSSGNSIYAADGGTVVSAGYRNSYGNVVEINHRNGLWPVMPIAEYSCPCGTKSLWRKTDSQSWKHRKQHRTPLTFWNADQRQIRKSTEVYLVFGFFIKSYGEFCAPFNAVFQLYTSILFLNDHSCQCKPDTGAWITGIFII